MSHSMLARGALSFGRNPEWLGLEPISWFAAFAFSGTVEVETFFAIDEGIVDDAVRFDACPSGQRDVIGEGRRGKDRDKSIGSQPLGFHSTESRKISAIKIVMPHAIEADQDDDRLLLFRRLCRANEQKGNQER